MQFLEFQAIMIRKNQQLHDDERLAFLDSFPPDNGSQQISLVFSNPKRYLLSVRKNKSVYNLKN